MALTWTTLYSEFASLGIPQSWSTVIESALNLCEATRRPHNTDRDQLTELSVDRTSEAGHSRKNVGGFGVCPRID